MGEGVPEGSLETATWSTSHQRPGDGAGEVREVCRGDVEGGGVPLGLKQCCGVEKAQVRSARG